MCFESPVRGSVHTCRCESTFDSKLVLSCLNIICYFLQCLKIVDLICRLDHSAIHLTIFLKKRFVVNNSICFNYICDTINCTAVILQYKIIAFYIFVNIAVLQVIAIILPGCKSNRSVNLEQCRNLILGHL